MKTNKKLLEAFDPGTSLKVKKKRKLIKTEKVFYDAITSLIKNLLINNPNYNNGYYNDKTILDFKLETIERSNHILTKLKEIKHLINL